MFSCLHDRVSSAKSHLINKMIINLFIFLKPLRKSFYGLNFTRYLSAINECCNSKSLFARHIKLWMYNITIFSNHSYIRRTFIRKRFPMVKSLTLLCPSRIQVTMVVQLYSLCVTVRPFLFSYLVSPYILVFSVEFFLFIISH